MLEESPDDLGKVNTENNISEKELSEKNLELARTLTQTALDNCRDLIRYYRNESLQPVVPLPEDIPIFEIAVLTSIVAAMSLLVFYLLKRRMERIRRGRSKSKAAAIRT